MWTSYRWLDKQVARLSGHPTLQWGTIGYWPQPDCYHHLIGICHGCSLVGHVGSLTTSMAAGIEDHRTPKPSIKLVIGCDRTPKASMGWMLENNQDLQIPNPHFPLTLELQSIPWNNPLLTASQENLSHRIQAPPRQRLLLVPLPLLCPPGSGGGYQERQSILIRSSVGYPSEKLWTVFD